MKIARIFHPGAPYVSPHETLRAAAAQMCSHGVSCLPVIAQRQLVGTLTERDILEAAAKGVSPLVAHVADYMNDGKVAVSLDDDSSVAAVTMLAIGCRHLPVVDRGRLVGMVSARDIFLAAAPKDAERVAVV